MAGEHHDRDALLAQYEELSRQASTLHRQNSISSSTSDVSTFEPTSPFSIPFRTPEGSRTTTSSPTRERHHQRRRSCSHTPIIPSLNKSQTMPTSLRQDFAYGPSPALSRESSLEDDGVHATTQQIKVILLDLLNCEGVRHDVTWRTWVQGRLMDVEMDLREYRRRRSSVCVDERMLKCISSHLECHASGVGMRKRESI